MNKHWNGSQWVIWVTDGSASWPVAFATEAQCDAMVAYIQSGEAGVTLQNMGRPEAGAD